ncbi:HTH domain-containing protein [Rhodococcus sp. MS16]|uniref:HTH domain-containing protein n=1 Tax=Rhodococcus sp. MS16 TaxID=2579941 RepID=UPI001562A3C0|nr:HTH domain-containing protein [Rhodococcus sp. MS16]NRI69919.1 HTH domain-containing protein [Rhodococcus sp. MS16]
MKAIRTVAPKIKSREFHAYVTWIEGTDENWCRIANLDTLANEIGVSRSVVDRTISTLKSTGLISVQPRTRAGYGKIGNLYQFALDTCPEWDAANPVKTFVKPKDRSEHINDWTVDTDHERNHERWGIDIEFEVLLEALRSGAVENGQEFRSSWDQTFGAFLKAVRDDTTDDNSWWWVTMPNDDIQ